MQMLQAHRASQVPGCKNNSQIQVIQSNDSNMQKESGTKQWATEDWNCTTITRLALIKSQLLWHIKVKI